MSLSEGHFDGKLQRGVVTVFASSCRGEPLHIITSNSRPGVSQKSPVLFVHGANIFMLPKFPSILQPQTPLEDRPIFRKNVGNAIGDAPHPQRLPGFSSDPPNLAGSSVIKKTTTYVHSNIFELPNTVRTNMVSGRFQGKLSCGNCTKRRHPGEKKFLFARAKWTTRP